MSQFDYSYRDTGEWYIDQKTRPAPRDLLRRGGDQSHFNLEGFSPAIQEALRLGKAQTKSKTKGNPALRQMEREAARRLGLNVGGEDAKTSLAHIQQIRAMIRRRGERNGVTFDEAGQVNAERAYEVARSQATQELEEEADPEYARQIRGIREQVTRIQEMPNPDTTAFIFGNPPENRENPSAFRFQLFVRSVDNPEYVNMMRRRQGEPVVDEFGIPSVEGFLGEEPDEIDPRIPEKILDRNCSALKFFIRENCPSIWELLHERDVETIPRRPDWLRSVPTLLDRQTSRVYVGATALAFVKKAIEQEEKIARTIVQREWSRREQAMRRLQGQGRALLEAKKARLAQTGGVEIIPFANLDEGSDLRDHTTEEAVSGAIIELTPVDQRGDLLEDGQYDPRELENTMDPNFVIHQSEWIGDKQWFGAETEGVASNIHYDDEGHAEISYRKEDQAFHDPWGRDAVYADDGSFGGLRTGNYGVRGHTQADAWTGAASDFRYGFQAQPQARPQQQPAARRPYQTQRAASYVR